MRFILGLVLAAVVLAGCGGGGGDGGGGGSLGPGASAPVISSLSPSSAPAGSAALTLTVSGSNFVAASIVDWNGAALTTTYVSATQLTAEVPAAEVATAGMAEVIVVNPDSDGGTSAASAFTIGNPPTISSLSPASTLAGSAAFTLTVNGSNFVSASVIDWNGAALTTTYVSATQLTAEVPAAEVATAGMAEVIVVNPDSDGGTSAASTFTIGAAPDSGPQLVQWNVHQTTSNNGEMNSAAQFTSLTKAGHTIWVAVTVSDYAEIHQIAVSDTQGNAYTLLDQENDPRPGAQTVAHFYAANIAGDTTTPDTVTVTWTSDDYKGVLIAEISGTTASALVGHARNDQDGLPAGTNNVTAGPIAVPGGQTPALLVALSMDTTGGASDTGGSGASGPTAGTGMTLVKQIWDWGANLATFVTAPITSAGNVTAVFDATDTDSYVTVAAVFY